MAENNETPGPGAGASGPENLVRDEKTAKDGEHLTRRQERNSELTEKAQQDPTGGAHSDRTDPTNP